MANRGLQRRTKVAVVASDLPIEQNIFHSRALADIVDNHVTAARRGLLVHDNTNMGNAPTQIPSDKIARRVVIGAAGQRQRLSVTRKEDHQVRHAPVIDVRIGATQ